MIAKRLQIDEQGERVARGVEFRNSDLNADLNAEWVANFAHVERAALAIDCDTRFFVMRERGTFLYSLNFEGVLEGRNEVEEVPLGYARTRGELLRLLIAFVPGFLEWSEECSGLAERLGRIPLQALAK